MFGIRLKQFAESKFGSVNAMAKAIGISQPNLTRYIKEEVQPTKVLFERLLDFGCDIEWLLTGKIRQEHAQAEDSKGTHYYPVVSAVGAGSVTPYDDIISEPIPMPYAGEGVLLKVVGESMAALIQEGDLVLVDSKKKPKEGNIVAVRTKAGEQFVKYLGARSKQTVMFYSHNSIYAPVTYQISDLVTVKKVVMILKDVDF